MTKFPCPKCEGNYVEPYMVNAQGKAMCECKTHGLFETSIAVSKNFRQLCSKVASHPTKSQTYYTSTEKRAKGILDTCGYKEGFDYIHNVRIKTDYGSYIWLDFYIPREYLVIEISPKIWHSRWNRDESEKKKLKFLFGLSLRVVTVDENHLSEIKDHLEWAKE